MTEQVLIFDLRAEPCELAPGQWAPLITRPAEDQRGACLHSWGVEVGTTIANRRRFGSEAHALARRALRVPYHISWGVTRGGVPIVALAHPVERYTFHGDHANRDFVGIGGMVYAPSYERSRTTAHTAITDAHRAAMDMALGLAAVEYLGGREGLDLIAHRNACNQSSDHYGCCTEAVVALACGSSAVASGVFIPRPDVCLHRLSRAWKPDWRRHIVASAPPVTTPPVDEAAVADAQMAIADMVARFG